jgi:DNA-binding transcriptional LysR family regulator
MHTMKLSGLDLDLLVTLDALLDTGSVSAAAAQLHRSQPAVSRMLGRLRDIFGDPLFVPHGRGLAPTPRALALRGPLKLSLSEVQQLLTPPRAFDPARDTAHFRIVSSDYAAVALMGSIVSWLHERAPNVSLSLLPVTGNPLNLLAEGGAEILFGPQEFCPPWCESMPFIEDSWLCVRRQGEALPTTAAEYLRMAHVAVDFVGAQFEEALRLQGGAKRKVQVTVADFAAAVFITANSPLLATLPGPVARAAAKLMPLAVGEVPFAVRGSSVSMIWPRRLDRDPGHAWLRGAVRESVGVEGNSGVRLLL